MTKKYWSYTNLDALIGLTLMAATRDDGGLTFITEDGRWFRLEHQQDCCESVSLEDVCGDLQDLKSYNNDEPPSASYEPESYTWSFYRFATNKGGVTVRFYGESNGYYSESASLYEEKAWP